MPPYKNKTNKKRESRNFGVQSDAKKQVRKNVASSSDESEECESRKKSSELDGVLNKCVGVPRLKLILSRDLNSKEFQCKVQDYFSDEEIFDEKPKKPATSKKANNVEESVELQNSMKNLNISNQNGRMTRSQRLSINEETKNLEPKWQKVTKKASIEKKDLNSTPARQTRRSSTASLPINDSQTPSHTRLSKMSPFNLNNQSPLKSERQLRERNRMNYKEDESPQDQKAFSLKPRSETKRESTENELTETPRKRGRIPRKGTPSRIPLQSVNEKSNENDPSLLNETLEEFTPLSRRQLSTRGRKSVAARDSDFIYEESPKKRKSTIATTPGRKRVATPERNMTKSPGRNITATPRRSIAMTPRGRRTLTPSMHQRSANISKPKTSLQEFRARLHVSFVPKSLPCREAEFNNIFTFLQSKLAEETGGCIYISGVPGTGKTATVNEVISCLKKLETQGELPSFQFVDINGMKLTEPRQAYVQIQKSLTGVTSSWEEAQRCLHQRFTTPASRSNMTLLLIDELDLLCTKRQDVVYNLLDWPTYKSSHLVVITIANTMDLPERVLMGRVTSRLGLTRLTFQSYNHAQLKEIVKTRLKDSEAFKSEAIELVARKVASVSGDARRALDICRRATEIAESNSRDCVTMKDVISALEEMIANPRVQAIKCCSLMERKFLEAVFSEVSRTGVEQVTLKNIYKQFDILCRMDGEEVPNITQVLEICRKLASGRLILWESGADLYQSILLNVSADDIYFSKQKIS